MDVQGETAMVSLAKEGPIYSVEWAPKMAQFCVVYGFMPAKATLYNKKCEKVFDFGTGPRNLALFNGQGNLLMLGNILTVFLFHFFCLNIIFRRQNSEIVSTSLKFLKLPKTTIFSDFLNPSLPPINNF